MALFPALFDKLKALGKPTIFVYPLVVITAIPFLLAINTIWNLRAFNRDVNFIIRNQAVSLADTIKPFISQNLNDAEKITEFLKETAKANSDIVSATVLVVKEGKVEVLASTLSIQEASSSTQLGLNQLALGFNQPFAGLSYDPHLGKNVWNVVVPLSSEGQTPHLLLVKLKTEVVDAILKRTSRDSFVILSILIVVTLILLTNHFFFYRKALKAEQLAELDRLKDEFISMAAHELRAPVSALVGYLSLLRDKIPPSGKDVLESELNTLDTITVDLRDLINDLLDVSRIEQGRLAITFAETQVNEAILKVIKTFTLQAEQKGLVIKFIPETLPKIKTDPDRLRQILTNLVSNSIKYTLKGEISIAATPSPKFIEVTIRDSGVGIPPEELPKLFSKFHRIKDERTVEVRGTGLGLWITEQIVKLLGGKIYAESIYGTGSVFTFTLPLS